MFIVDIFYLIFKKYTNQCGCSFRYLHNKSRVGPHVRFVNYQITDLHKQTLSVTIAIYTSKAKIIETKDIIIENIEAHIAPDAYRFISSIVLTSIFI
tara:strand:- start:1965 stop:2255 length:291 start_codon:yes stop_codon:yes gene_type:complete